MMLENGLRAMYRSRLSAVKMTDDARRDILSSVRQRKGVKRISTAFVLALTLMLLSVGAAAWALAPSIEGWLRTLGGSASLTPDAIEGKADGQTLTVGGVRATLHEALIDEDSFIVNMRFEADGDRQLLSYSGLAFELPPESSALYVSCVAYRGKASNEIFTERADENALHILCEGRDSPGDNTLTMEITCAEYRDGAWNIAKDTMTATVAPLPTLETAALAAPVALGDTGFVLDQLSVRKTALRVYRDVSVVRRGQALKYAVLPLSVKLFDPSGEEMARFLPYEDGVPGEIRARVVNDETGETLNETALILTENGYEVK